MPHGTENWDLLQTLFHLASETPVEDRRRVLFKHCDDAALVEKALEILDRSTSDNQRDATDAGQKRSDGHSHRMGSWTLLHIIGSGGIGTVYLAERIFGGAPQRTAIKVLAPHAAGPAFTERFHREQHILGLLDHPHITRLLDAGVSEAGQPYLVMEFIDGEHFDVFCDARNLRIEERMRLFLQVCDAVAYAHRNLIVHLDLKPSNILVTGQGSVKLLDFGTSKLIPPDAQQTTTVMATPAYASPEQLRNEPVTTACDIYALGAILFELLSGQRPFAKSSGALMIEHAARERIQEKMADVLTTSAALQRGESENRLRQILSDDLSTIVSKCLESDPRSRYASVDSLSEDISRYIEGRPILARPQTTFYRVTKFVSRNWRTVTAIAVLAVLFLGLLSFAELKQRRAIDAGHRAEQMQSMLFALFSIAHSQNLGKPTVTVTELLNLGVKLLPLYIHDRTDLRAGQISLATSLYKNSDYEDAGKVFEQSMQTAHQDGDIDAETMSMAYAGDIAFRSGNIEKGKRLTAKALELSRSPMVTAASRVATEDFYANGREVNEIRSDENLRLMQEAIREAVDKKLPARDIAKTIESMGVIMQTRKRWSEAESFYKQAQAYYAQDPAFTCDSAELSGEVGRIERMRGDFEDALVQNQYAYDTTARCTGPESSDALVEEKYMAQDLLQLGRAAEAKPIMEKVVKLERQRDGGAKGPVLANSLYVLAGTYLATGMPMEAAKLVHEELEMVKGKLSPESTGYGYITLLYAQALDALQRDKESLEYAEEADRAFQSIGADNTYLDRKHAEDTKQLLQVLKSRTNSPNLIK